MSLFYTFQQVYRHPPIFARTLDARAAGKMPEDRRSVKLTVDRSQHCRVAELSRAAVLPTRKSCSYAILAEAETVSV
jgi:hypothetical protein